MHGAGHMLFPARRLAASLQATSRKHRTVLKVSRASLVAQLVKNLPAMQETWVRSLGWEAPLKEGMATHSSILAWRIPMDMEAPGGLQFMGL